jgi:hypothetical protein
MSVRPATLQLSVVADAEKEIENVLDAPQKLKQAIEELEKQRAKTKSELCQLLAKDLVATPPSVSSPIAKYKVWNARDKALEARIVAAKQLRPIIHRCIKELKETQPDACRAAYQRKLDQLEEEAAADRRKEALRRAEIARREAEIEILKRTVNYQFLLAPVRVFMLSLVRIVVLTLLSLPIRVFRLLLLPIRAMLSVVRIGVVTLSCLMRAVR